MNLLELLGEFVPEWFIRRSLAFVLGFCLMCMVLAAHEVWIAHWVP
jgi:hypothetical protein